MARSSHPIMQQCVCMFVFPEKSQKVLNLSGQLRHLKKMHSLHISCILICGLSIYNFLAFFDIPWTNGNTYHLQIPKNHLTLKLFGKHVSCQIVGFSAR